MIRIIGAAEAGLSDIKAEDECSAIVNKRAFSKIETNVRSWCSAGMKWLSVSFVTYLTYIILVIITYFFWSAVYVDSLNVLFAFDIHRQTSVPIHYSGPEKMTNLFMISFESQHHFAEIEHAESVDRTQKVFGKVLLWHKETLDFNFFPSAQQIFSIFSLNEAMDQKQLSVCNGYLFRQPFPRSCQTKVIYNAKCNGPLPTCTAEMCLKKTCEEKSTHVVFGFDAHAEAHLIPEQWPKQHDLHVQIKKDDETFTKILLDTSDSIRVSEAEATLSLEKLNAPFDINGTTLSLHEGTKEDSDMEAIAYSIISAILFSIWVYSTGTSDTPNVRTNDSRLGISDIFVKGSQKFGQVFKNNVLLESLLHNLKSLRVAIIFNSSFSICIASIVAVLYEISNDTVFTFLGTELSTIFTDRIQILIVVLYTCLGCVPFLVTGPILIGLMDLKRFKNIQKQANRLTGFNSKSKAYLLVVLRLCFEIQLISAFQIHIPPSAGIPFQNVVSFALAITLLVITGRDLTILHYDRENKGTFYSNVITWLVSMITIAYCTLAMTTPFLWSSQIADYTDILPLSTAITSVSLMLGSNLFSNRFSQKPASKVQENKQVSPPKPQILF